MNYNAILIDDEPMALDVMDYYLREIGGVTVAGRFGGAAEALSQAPSLQPDLIFLDIEMPGSNGLSAAELFRNICPAAEIVFVTAHAHYAMDAFDRHALGYLLKPVDKHKLIKVLDRYAQLHAGRGHHRTEQEAPSHVRSASDLLRLQILGSLELYTSDGRLLTWRTKKTKELFAFLWHHQGQPVYKYTILEELWPDAPAERSQRLLHTSLYYLRSMFKSEGYSEIVMHGDERYWINISVIQSDTGQLYGMMQRSLHGTDLKRALAMYSGDYLEKEHYQWADARRIDMRLEFVSCMDQALDQAPAQDQPLILRKLIQLEPNNEAYYDRLVNCLNRLGDQAGARQMEAAKKRMMMEDG
ncbi:response regulator [Paenibacillus mendelii]|uniref:Response regulator n=1 Tax=Paenibacillus mendelii TaxID=206163 RepID=A0ABV6JCF7_9BACL|nr:response regulator [Paenibacillus mendelii]MCQ6561585.1 response regulator [Paenibacillus mendelii]